MAESSDVPLPQAVDSVLSKYQLIAISKIKPSRHQARKAFDEDALKNLAASMKAEGLIQAITVRQNGDDYELVAGERRWRAAKLLGWTDIEAKVIRTVSEAESAAKGLVENLQNQALDPLEEAGGFQELINLDPDYWSQKKVAEVTGKSPTYINESLLLLTLPDAVKEKFCRQNFSRSHGVELARLPTPEAQMEGATRIEGLNREQAREVIKTLKGKSPSPAHPLSGSPVPIVPDPYADLWPALREKLGHACQEVWQIGYGPFKALGGGKEMTWMFALMNYNRVSPKRMTAWLRQIAQGIEDAHLPDPDAEMKRTNQKAADIWFPKTKEETQDMKASSLNAKRLPNTPEEWAEVEALARTQGPGGVYEWMLGADNYWTRKAKKLSWQDLEAADPVAECHKIIDGRRKFNSPASSPAVPPTPSQPAPGAAKPPEPPKPVPPPPAPAAAPPASSVPATPPPVEPTLDPKVAEMVARVKARRAQM